MGFNFSSDLSGLRDELLSGLRELRKEVEREGKKVGQAVGDGYEDGYEESVEEIRKSKEELLRELEDAKRRFEQNLNKFPNVLKNFFKTLNTKELTRTSRALNKALNDMGDIRNEFSEMGESFDIGEWIDSMRHQSEELFKSLGQQASATKEAVEQTQALADTAAKQAKKSDVTTAKIQKQTDALRKQTKAANELNAAQQKQLNMVSAIKRYNKLMHEIGKSHLTVGKPVSEGASGADIKDMVGEAQRQLDDSYSMANRPTDKAVRKDWESQRQKLIRFVNAYRGFVNDMASAQRHMAQQDVVPAITAETQAIQQQTAAIEENKRARRDIAKPVLLQRMEILEDSGDIYDARTEREKREAALQLLKEAYQEYRDLQTALTAPNHMVRGRVFDFEDEDIERQRAHIETLVALYEKYGGKVEKLGKRLRGSIEEWGFSGKYQSAFESYKTQLVHADAPHMDAAPVEAETQAIRKQTDAINERTEAEQRAADARRKHLADLEQFLCGKPGDIGKQSARDHLKSIKQRADWDHMGDPEWRHDEWEFNFDIGRLEEFLADVDLIRRLFPELKRDCSSAEKAFNKALESARNGLRALADVSANDDAAQANTATRAIEAQTTATEERTEATKEYIAAQQKLQERAKELRSDSSNHLFHKGGAYRGSEGRLRLAASLANDLSKFDLSNDELNRLVESTYEQFSKVRSLLVDKETWITQIRAELNEDQLGKLLATRYQPQAYGILAKENSDYRDIVAQVRDGIISAQEGFEEIDKLVRASGLERYIKPTDGAAQALQAETQAIDANVAAKKNATKTMEDFMNLWDETAKGYSAEDFGKKYGYLLEAISGVSPTMSIDDAYAELQKKEEERRQQVEAERAINAARAKEFADFNNAMAPLMPQLSSSDALMEQYAHALEEITEGSLTAAKATERLRNALDGVGTEASAQSTMPDEQATIERILGERDPQQIEQLMRGVDLKAIFKEFGVPKDARGEIERMFEMLAVAMHEQLSANMGGDSERAISLGRITNALLPQIENKIMSVGSMRESVERQYDDIYAYLNGQQIYYTDKDKAEFGDEWNSYIRRFRKTLTKDKKALGPDQVYQELLELFRGHFDPEIWNATDQLRVILDAFQKARDERNIKTKTRAIPLPKEAGEAISASLQDALGVVGGNIAPLLEQEAIHSKLIAGEEALADAAAQTTVKLEEQNEARREAVALDDQMDDGDATADGDANTETPRIVDLNQLKALEQLRNALQNKTNLIDLSDVYDTVELEQKLRAMTANILGDQSPLSVDAVVVQDNMASIKLYNKELGVTLTQIYRLNKVTKDAKKAQLGLFSEKYTHSPRAQQIYSEAQQREREKNDRWLISQLSRLDTNERMYKYSRKPIDGDTSLLEPDTTSLEDGAEKTIDGLVAHIKARIQGAMEGTLTGELKNQIENDIRVLSNEIKIQQYEKYANTELQPTELSEARKSLVAMLDTLRSKANKNNVFAAISQDFDALYARLTNAELPDYINGGTGVSEAAGKLKTMKAQVTAAIAAEQETRKAEQNYKKLERAQSQLYEAKKKLATLEDQGKGESAEAQQAARIVAERQAEYDAAQKLVTSQDALNKAKERQAELDAELAAFRKQEADKQEAKQAQQFTDSIRSAYAEIVSIIKQINSLDSKINDLTLKDQGSGMYAGIIQNLRTNRDLLVNNLNAAQNDLSSALWPDALSTGQMGGADQLRLLLQDTRLQAALTAEEIQNIQKALLQAENVRFDFGAKLAEQTQPVLEQVEHLIQLVNSGAITDAGVIGNIAAIKENIGQRAQAFKKDGSPEAAMDFMKYVNNIAEYIAKLDKAAKAEQEYFANKQQYANIEEYTFAAESDNKVSSAQQKLEAFVKTFAHGKAVITNFITSANGISKIDFSVLDESTQQFRTFSAEVGMFSNKIATYETSMRNLTAGTDAAKKAMAAIAETMARLSQMQDSGIDVSSQSDPLWKRMQELRDKLTEIGDSKDVGSQTLLRNLATEAQKAVKDVAQLEEQWRKTEQTIDGNKVVDLGSINQAGNIFQQMYAKIQYEADGAEISNIAFNRSTNTMTYTLTSANGVVTKMTASMDALTSKVITQKGQISTLDSMWSGLASGIGGAFKQLGGYVVNLFQITDLIRYMRTGFEAVKEIDSALTELKKVTDETEASYQRFLQTASQRAGNIGSTVSDFTRATSEFARLGYSMEESANMAEAAIVYKNVADGIDTVEASTESIISTMMAFGIAADDTMSIIDRFNEVGNNFAISSAGIGEALQRSASALYAAGNTIDEAIALVTAGNSVIQNPEQVGTALKTLALRLRGAKTELEDAGLETDSMAESTSSLQEKLKALTGGKVDIMADATTFKSTTQILREMSEAWEDMTDIERASALELMGGKRQANILSSLIENFDIVEDVIETSMNSEGSALAENATHMDSIQGRLEKLSNATQTMWMNFMDTDVVKWVVDLCTEFVKLADTIGLIPTALGAFTTFRLVKDTIKQDFADIGTIIKESVGISGKDAAKDVVKDVAKDAVESATKDASKNAAEEAANAIAAVTQARDADAQVAAKAVEVQEKATEAMKEQIEVASDAVDVKMADTEADLVGAAAETTEAEAIEGNTTATTANTVAGVQNVAADVVDNAADTAGAASEDAETAAIHANTAATVANTVAQKALHAAKTLGKGLLIGAAVTVATMAIGKLVGVVDDWIHAEEKAIERANDALNKYRDEQEELKDQKKTVDELSESYTRLSTGVDTLTNTNIGLTTEAYQEYLEVCNDIAEMFPELVDGYDAQGNAIIDLKGDVEQLTAAYIRAQEEAARTILTDDNLSNVWTKYESNDMNSAGKYWLEDDNGNHSIERNVSLQDQRDILRIISSMGYDDLMRFYGTDKEGGFLDGDIMWDILQKQIEAMGIPLTIEEAMGIFNSLNIPANKLTYDEYVAYINNEIASLNRTITENMSGIREVVSASLLFDEHYNKLGQDARAMVQTIINNMDPNLVADSGAENADDFIDWFSTNVIAKVADNEDMYADLTDVSNKMAKAMLNGDMDAFKAAQAEFMALVQSWADESGNIVVDPEADPVTQYLQQLALDMQNKAKNFEVRMEIRADIELQPKRPINEVVAEQTEDAQQEIKNAVENLESFADDATLGDIFGTISVNLDVNEDGKLRADEIRDAYDAYVASLTGDEEALAGWTEPQIEAIAALHALCQMYGTDIATITDEMIQAGYAFKSLDGVTSFNLASESTNEFVDKFQDDIDAIKGAWESLNSGEMTQSDFLDLAQEFPELMDGVDFSDDNWMTKAKANLEALNATTVDSFIAELNEMKDAMAARGEDTSIIDSMIAYAQQYRDMAQIVDANTVAGLTEAHDRYKSIMEETNEILFNGQKVSEGYYESLVEYIDDTEALNACFDKNNRQIVTNVEALKELIAKQREADTQTVRLAKSQAQFRYYELVRQLGDTVRSFAGLSTASDTTVASLLDQIGVIKDAIAQYQLLEDNLLGTTNAFERFAAAKELDDQNTYGASYAEMAQVMYDALYETGQVGSAQFWAAVEATVPDNIYKHLMPGTEQIRAIYDYFNKNIMPTLTFDEDSFSIDYSDIEAFIKKAQEVGVFSGTDATSFGLSSDFIYGLEEGEVAIEAFAKRMGMTVAQVYAMLSEMDKYTTDGAGLSMLMQLDTSTSGQITYITSELEKLYAQRRALMQQGASDTVLAANMAQIYEYESQLAGLQKQAANAVRDYIAVQNALVDTSKTVREALPYEIWHTELGLTGDETVMSVLQQIHDYVLTLQEPTVMELQIARDSIDDELDGLIQRFGEENLEANVTINEDGLREIKDGNLTIDAATLERYIELKNAQLFIDDTLMNSMSVQEQLLTNIDKNVAAIAGEEPASGNNDDNTQGGSSTTKSSNNATGGTTDTPTSKKPEPNAAAALLTLDTGKAIYNFANAVSRELAAEESQVGIGGSVKALELASIGNKALQLQEDLYAGKIFAEDAIAQLSELQTEAAYWDVEIPVTFIIEPKELAASAEDAADGLTITPDVDLGSRPLMKFDGVNFAPWVDYYNDILANADDYDTGFVKHAWDELAALNAGTRIEPVYPQIYYSERFMSIPDLENDVAVVLTPILPDGTVLSPAELEAYAERLFMGEEIEPDITLGFFDGEDYKTQAEEFVVGLNQAQNALYGINGATQEAVSEAEALYGVYASPEEALAALEAIGDKNLALTSDEALAFGWTLAEGEILTVADAIKRVRQEQDALRRTSVYNPEQFQESVAMVKTLSELQEEISDYNEVLTQTEEIISDNIEVSQEYKDSLIELGITEEELNECFDDGNPLLVTNAQLLNKLVKGAKSNVATNIKLAKSQAQLEYYELYKEIAKLTDGTQEIDGATLEYIQSLYGQMGAIQQNIAQFAMLEAQLLGATSAYEQLEAAQAADSANDYGSRAEELVNILGHAFNTGELGTQAAQTAIAGLIPDGVIDKALTLDEQMRQIYEYFTKGKVSQLFTIEFDDDGNISSVEMTRENVEAFTQSLIGSAESGAVFQGTWDEFTLNPAIKTLDDFAAALGVTKEVAFAYLTELEKYDINWLGGDYETILDQLMGDNLEYKTQKTIQKMAQLRQEMASIMVGGIENDSERSRIAEIEAELAQLESTMSANRETAYNTWQAYSEIDGVLADTANMGKKVSEVFSNDIIQAVGLTGDETVQEVYDRLLAYKTSLGQPIVLQLASEQVMEELDALKSELEDNRDIDIEANVHFNTETGEFEYVGDTTGWSPDDLANLGRYLELSGDLYEINSGLGLGIEAMEGYAQRTADAVESIDQKLSGDAQGNDKDTQTGAAEGTSAENSATVAEYDIILHVDDAAVDEYIPDDKQAEVLYMPDGTALVDYIAENKAAQVLYTVNGDAIAVYNPEDKTAYVLYDANGEALMGYNPEDKYAQVLYTANGEAVAVYTPEDKTARVLYDVDGNAILAYNPEDKNAQVLYDVNGTAVALYVPENKTAYVLYTADGTSVSDYIAENKAAQVLYTANGEAVALYNPGNKTASVLYTADGTAVISYTPGNKDAQVLYTANGDALALYVPGNKAAQVLYAANGTAVTGYVPENKNATVLYTVDGTAVVEYIPANKTAKVIYTAVHEDQDELLNQSSNNNNTKENTKSESISIDVVLNKDALETYAYELGLLDQQTIADKEVNVEVIGASEATSELANVDEAAGDVTKTVTVMSTYAASYGVFGGETDPGNGGKNYPASGYGHANGTAHAQGTAHKGGAWGAPKTETALTGELGPELRVRGNRWELIGQNGAEFNEVRKGDIIFNHKQTEELMTNGYITGRGKAFAEGTVGGTAYAFAREAGVLGGGRSSNNGSKDDKTVKADTVQITTDTAGVNTNTFTDYAGSLNDDYSNKGDDTSGGGGGGGSDDKDEPGEVFDWIEVRLEEIHEDINLNAAKLENAIGSTKKNAIIDDMIGLNQDLHDTLIASANEYYRYAEKLLADVPAEYRAAAKDGKIAIEEFVGEVDEETLNAIQKYREWVQKGADVTQQAEEVLTEISNLAKQAIDNIAQDYENKSSFSDSKIGQFESYNALIETDIGYESEGIYRAMIEENNRRIGVLQEQRNAMLAELNKRVEAGEIQRGSQAWYDAINEIAAVDTEIVDLKTDTENWQDAINDLHWDKFDSLISRLQSVSEEAENLIDILDNSDMVDEAGNWTDEGITSLGLYAQQMEAAEVEAKKYQDEIDYLNKNWQKLGYTEDEYLERLGELKDGQYAAIQSYHDSKDAIVDMTKARVDAIKEGIDKEIEAMEELISKKKEELDAQKDLYDFQKGIANQQKNIAEIQRKLAALSSDNSAAARAKRAQLEAELAEAQQELSDTYYDRSVSNQQEALDKELDAFREEKDKEKEGWDEYLTNTNQVVSDCLATVQENTETVYQVLQGLGEEYGLSITESLTAPWQEGENAIQSFTEKFGISMSATVEELQKLEGEFIETMANIELAGKDAAQTVRDNFRDYKEAEKLPEQSGDGDNSGGGGNGNGGSSSAGMVSGISGTIKQGQSGDNVKALQQALNELGFNCGNVDGIFGSKTLAAVKKFQQSSKYGGAISADGIVGANTKKKFKVAGYAGGTTGVKSDQWALIDELGEELVIRPSNGRMAFMEKGTGVVPAGLTSNLMEWGELDPSIMLERNKPVISATHVINNNIEVNMEFSELIHIDTVTNDTIPNLTKAIEKQMDKYMKNVNNNIRKYAR